MFWDAKGVMLLLGLGVVLGITALVICRACLKSKLEAILGLWDDIYRSIVERCSLCGTLSQHLLKWLRGDPKIVDDIQFLLQRMADTNDPHTHAAVQNGLVLTVQTAVDQFHRHAQLKDDSDLFRTMQAIGVVDSRLAPLRDKFNERVRRYNKLLNTPPFSLVAWIGRVEERSLFPMLIPWWSTDPAAYGSISADDIRQTLQTWRAPLILAPSHQPNWQGSPSVIRVADKLMGRQPTSSNGAARPNSPDGV